MPTHKISIFFSAVILLLAAASCNTQPLPTISGNITLSEGWKPVVYLVQPRSFAEIASNYSGVVVDSAVIRANGDFAFANVPRNERASLFQLCVQQAGNRFPNQLSDDNALTSNYMPVIAQASDLININAVAGRFQASFTIQKPSAENLALCHLRDIRLQSYRAHLSGIEKEPDENTLLEHEDALLKFRQPLMAFADSCSTLWPALVATRWVSPAGDYERVPEFLFGQCDKWSGIFPDNPWVAQLCTTGNREKLPVLAGDLIPDFPMPMVTGDTVALHKLLGPKLTILDIWASWCAPCRRENREVLSPVYNHFREKGLQIIGYSIDSSPTAWKAAIAKDGSAWPHASHLSGDATPFMDELRISTIPANFILDAKGKVLTKNLHGEALKAFVEAYFR